MLARTRLVRAFRCLLDALCAIAGRIRQVLAPFHLFSVLFAIQEHFSLDLGYRYPCRALYAALVSIKPVLEFLRLLIVLRAMLELIKQALES